MKNARTIVTISEQEKRWLAAYSGLNKVSVAEAIRRGIACLRASEGPDAYRQILRETAGMGRMENGLTYQERVRSEWERDE